MYRKRERTQNWSVEEKKYLLELVKSRLDVLENKRIDSASSAMKGMAWQDIHAAFAARFGNDRDAHRVREQWRRMKGQARTEMMEFAERVRNYGADVANQRWPSALSEDVWKTLETARKMNEFQQGYGGGDDVSSPVTMMDDDEDDGDDGYDPDGSAAGGADRMSENGIKMEPDGDRYDGNHHHQDQGRDYDADVRALGHALGHGMGHGMAEDAGAGLMNMLRPKVELNDVPEVDTSMVPSGLSITAVKIGSSGQKRRLMDRRELPARSNPWDSPGQTAATLPREHREHREHRDVRDVHALALLGPGHGVRPSRSATPQQQHQGANGLPPPSVQESKRLELRRRLEMMEEEHNAKMALLRVEKETADVRRRIALREEAEAASALTCRSCGGERMAGAVRSERLSTDAADRPDRPGRPRRPIADANNEDAAGRTSRASRSVVEVNAIDASTAGSAATGSPAGSPTGSPTGSGSPTGTGPSSPAGESRDGSERSERDSDVAVNGVKQEDDNSPE